MLGDGQQTSELPPIETTSDPNALGSLKISVAMIQMGFPDGMLTAQNLVSASRSLAYQQPDDHKPSPIIGPFRRMETLDTLYTGLKPDMDRMHGVMQEAAKRMG